MNEPGQPFPSRPSLDANTATRRFQDHSRQVQREARELFDAIEGTLSDVQGFLREQLEQRPYTTLGAAAGVGYILGGGLASRLTASMLAAGSRLAMAFVVRELASRAGLNAHNPNSRSGG